MKAIDSLPQSAEWSLKMVEVEGNILGTDGKPLTEEVELWMRNPLDCIRELLANPNFADAISYEPQKVFDDEAGRERRFDEMWTGDWWWEVQVSQLKSKGHAAYTCESIGSLATWCHDHTSHTGF